MAIFSDNVSLLSSLSFIRLSVNPMHEDLHDLKEILKHADSKTLTEIIRQAEAYLNAQLQAGIAADQRAVTFASVVGAVAAVLLGGFLAAAYSDAGPSNLGYVVFPGIIGLTVSMGLATWASRPTNWGYAGSNPKHWKEDVVNNVGRDAALAGQAKMYAECIAENKHVLEVNSKAMIGAQLTAFLSVLICMIIAGILAATDCL